MNGRNTSAGNHAGQRPPATSEQPKTAARKPSGTAPTSPMMSREGGKLATRNGKAAAASANNPVAGTPAEFGVFLRAEIAKWGKVVREANIQPE